jgi:chromosome segregation ATPase
MQKGRKSTQRKNNEMTMKMKTIILPSILLIAAGAIGACNTGMSSENKAAKEQESAQKDLDKAKADYQKEVENYRRDTRIRIAENNKAIEDYNTSLKADKAKMNQANADKVKELEQKNYDLQKRLDEFKTDDKSKWEQFKTELNRDLNALGQAFADLGKDSKKQDEKK